MDERKKSRSGSDRPPRLDNAPLDYAPENELGVVYLFSHLARRRYGIRIEHFQAVYPDCVGFRDGRRIRIEFEYRSRNFVQHRHNPRLCDWIVCWIHDWHDKPKHIRVIELRKLYDLGFNVWFQPSSGEFSEALSQIRYSCDWSVPSQASVGDLLLMYKATPYRFIDQIFLVSSGVVHEEAGWKPGKDYGASIRLICSLKAPLHFQELKNHPILGHAGFVRGQMRNRYKATEYWPELFQMILARNPDLRGKLKKYGPDRLS